MRSVKKSFVLLQLQWLSDECGREGLCGILLVCLPCVGGVGGRAKKQQNHEKRPLLPSALRCVNTCLSAAQVQRGPTTSGRCFMGSFNFGLILKQDIEVLQNAN